MHRGVMAKQSCSAIVPLRFLFHERLMTLEQINRKYPEPKGSATHVTAAYHGASFIERSSGEY